MDFLKWVISPEAQARFHEFISYGPTTPKAWDLIPQERWADLPSSPENLAKSVWVSVPWWAENDAKIAERYQATIQ
jgi:putative spermidine/putrescine transport system substrate-binding protein